MVAAAADVDTLPVADGGASPETVVVGLPVVTGTGEGDDGELAEEAAAGLVAVVVEAGALTGAAAFAVAEGAPVCAVLDAPLAAWALVPAGTD